MTADTPVVPSGWADATLADLALIDIGFAFKSAEYSETGIRLLRGENIEPGRLRWGDTRYWPPSKVLPTRHFLVEPGDVILAMDRPVVSGGLKLARATAGDCPCLLVQRVARIRGQQETTDLLYYALSSPAFVRHVLIGGQTGTQLPHVSGSRISSFGLRVPPLQEQRRITDALDSYLTRLDAAREGLKRVEANLRRYRASVLKAAVEGRLVPTEAELAKKEDRAYESASNLLARILKERRRRWEESEVARMKTAGVLPQNDQWKAKYKAPSEPDATNLPDLPEGWCWTTIDALLREPLRNGHSARRTEGSTGIRTLTLTAVTDGDFSEENTKLTVADPQYVADLWLEPDDLLVERSNTPELVGTSRLYRGPRRFAIFPDLLIRVRIVEWIPAAFLETCLMSPRARHHFQTQAQGIAGTMPKISQGTVEAMPIPLPPVAEAARIAVEVQRLLSVGEQIRLQATRNVRHVERLRQSILSWAFEGKVVDQNPDDEPASVLLRRIHQERYAPATEEKRPTGSRPRKTA